MFFSGFADGLGVLATFVTPLVVAGVFYVVDFPPCQGLFVPATFFVLFLFLSLPITTPHTLAIDIYLSIMYPSLSTFIVLFYELGH